MADLARIGLSPSAAEVLDAIGDWTAKPVIDAWLKRDVKADLDELWEAGRVERRPTERGRMWRRRR